MDETVSIFAVWFSVSTVFKCYCKMKRSFLQDCSIFIQISCPPLPDLCRVSDLPRAVCAYISSEDKRVAGKSWDNMGLTFPWATAGQWTSSVAQTCSSITKPAHAAAGIKHEVWYLLQHKLEVLESNIHCKWDLLCCLLTSFPCYPDDTKSSSASSITISYQIAAIHAPDDAELH